jgi:hypothetical protein
MRWREADYNIEKGIETKQMTNVDDMGEIVAIYDPGTTARHR